MISLENLGDGSVSDRNFQKLMSLVLDTGGQSAGIRFGTDTLTWASGQQFSAAKTVTHGLGRTPLVVLALGNGTGGPNLTTIQAFTIGATTFQVQGGFVTGTASGVVTLNIGWAVIG